MNETKFIQRLKSGTLPGVAPCSLYNNIRDQYLQHVGNIILYINEKNEIDKIKMFMSKEFVGYFAKIISDIIEVRHDKLFVKTQKFLNTTKLTNKLKQGGS